MNRKVLIVDDSLTMGRQLRKIIDTIPGFEVVAQATTGADGIKLHEQHKPDLVLLDLVMPVLDGRACLRAIIQRDSAARVVIISSLGEVGREVEEARRLGACAVVSKPFEPDEVRAVVVRIFAGGTDHD
jgi:two-component system chemotaxis response regulator CheY